MAESSTEGEQGGTVFLSKSKIPAKRKLQSNLSADYKVEEKKSKKSAPSTAGSHSITTTSSHYNLRPRVYSSSSFTLVTTTQSSPRIGSSKALPAKKSSSSPLLGAEKGTEKSTRLLKKTQRETPKLTDYSSSLVTASATTLPYYSLTTSSDTTRNLKSKVSKTASSHKSASDSRLSSKLSLLRASLTSGAHRGRDLGNHSSSQGSRGSHSTGQSHRGDQPKPEGSRRSQRTTEATGSCASNSRRGSQTKKRTWTRRQQPSMSTDDGLSEQGASSGQAPLNEAGQSSSSVAERNDESANSHSLTDDNELKDSDMSRLQSLLEARGVPPHLFGSLGPRMHQLLHRASTSSSNSKAQQLLQGIQSADEGQQLQAVIEMCQLLVMGNEESLAGFPIKQAVPALINLLNKEQKFELVNHACRALTYLMESLPRSTMVVVEAIPAFLEKLQSIECMDVAEQSLTALDMLSKRHGKAILQAGGMSTCLLYLDFFSISAQRSALAIASNCCSSVGPEDFHYVADAIQILSTRLQIQDKKSVESCCLAFSRLVDSFQNDKKHLKDLSAHGLLTSIQQLLMLFPPIISTGTFVMVLRMLSLLCSNCPDLAVDLIKNNIVETLQFLLFGSLGQEVLQDNVELVTRSPQEFFELTCFISELFPKLPQTGIFSVDALLNKSQQRSEHGLWQWRDDRGVWHSYSWIDSKIIEAAYHSGEDELSLATMGRTYTIDLNGMQQINDDTGTTRPVQRFDGSGESSSTFSSKTESVKVDSRIAILQEDSLKLEDSYTYKLFSCLYSILNSSVGIAIRNRCVNAILRMIYYAPAELLQVILKQHPISSIIGGMLQSNDIRTLVNALQLAEILMQKLPHIFHISFRREGVMHKAWSLANGSFLENSSQKGKEKRRCSLVNAVVAGEPYSTHCSHPIQVFEKPPSPPSRLGEVLRGKRRSKRNPKIKEKCQSVMEPDLNKQTEVTHLTKSVNLPTTSSLTHHNSKPSFFSSLTSSRWNAKPSTSLSSSSDGLPRVDVNSLNNTIHTLSTSRTADNKEKICTWIKEQAVKFCATYFDEEQGKSHPALDVLQKLSSATQKLATNFKEDTEILKVVRCVLSDSEEGASPFEILHSGLVPQLLSYLTLQTSGYPQPLESRLKRFLQVFMDLPENDEVTAIPLNDQKKPPLASLVAKLHCCVNQVEQFPVKVHDAPSGSNAVTGSRGSQALRFFSTHQIKCHLQRHPDCKNLKQWKGGPVKIDPLALVQAVERYLVVRGYGKLKETTDDLEGSEDDGSDDEIDESLALELQGNSMPRHHLEILIGDKVLPYNMTVYQAIKQYGQTDEDRDTDEDQGVLGRPSIWVGQHTIWFRPLAQGSDSSNANSKLRGGSVTRNSKTSIKRSLKDDLDKGPSSISQFLRNCLPSDLGISDPSIEVICLMRALYVLSNNWPLLFESHENNPLISNSDFINSKLSAKILRQLQDPIAVMTGNYPSWIRDLPKKCPFLFPFECRQQLFFSTAFDRERAMSKLQESIPDLINTEMSDRVAPRLDRKKHTVSRKDLITQAEKIIQDLGSSQSILEIQYDGEVGTGLGPTLEFYTLVSKEFQKSSMEMWRGSLAAPPPTEDAEEGVLYVHSPCGLFPAPIPKNTKGAVLAKLRNKFRFLGRFLGRAVLDFRMIDIPLSEAFYKWMLGVEHSFSFRDLQYVDPPLAKSMGQLQALVRQKKRLEEDTSLAPESLQLAIENLTLDGASVEDLGLDFILPGYASIELKKNGRNIPVTIHNLEEYIKLVVHWTFVEGVERQFQAFQEGFESVFSLANLNGFSPQEMDLLLCGSGGQKWDIKHLVDSCRPDHGYNHDSRAIKNLFEVMSLYDINEQRLFLQFVTGSPRLPVGGFRSLNPPLTIVRKTFEPPLSADNYLPSVMTCVNYLKLPDYSTKQIMEEKLKVAAQEGQRSFHLS